MKLVVRTAPTPIDEVAPGDAMRRLDQTLTTAVIVARGFAVSQVVGIAARSAVAFVTAPFSVPAWPASWRTRGGRRRGAGGGGASATPCWRGATLPRTGGARGRGCELGIARSPAGPAVVRDVRCGGLVVGAVRERGHADPPRLARRGSRRTRPRRATGRRPCASGRPAANASTRRWGRQPIPSSVARSPARWWTRQLHSTRRAARPSSRPNGSRRSRNATASTARCTTRRCRCSKPWPAGGSSTTTTCSAGSTSRPARLRRVLEGVPPDARADLGTALQELVQEFSMLGLEVALDSRTTYAGPGRPNSSRRCATRPTRR